MIFCGERVRYWLWLFMWGLLLGASVKYISKALDLTAVQVEERIHRPTDLIKKVKIFCLVVTTESYHKTKAIHVKNTWGTHCDKLVFASSVTDDELESVKSTENDVYQLLWAKTKNALTYTYENYYDDYDWFFKADDDAFVILDNMRFMLSAYSPDDPIYFGKKLKSEFGPYPHGGSGYVMSKTALKKFVTEALPDVHKCNQKDNGPEDINVAICLRNVGVYTGDGRDQFLRERFHSLTHEDHLFSLPNYWYWIKSYYVGDGGLDCCSNSTISFHYVQPSMMYLLEYLIYNFQAYGIRHVDDSMPKKMNSTLVRAMLAETIEKKVLNSFPGPDGQPEPVVQPGSFGQPLPNKKSDFMQSLMNTLNDAGKKRNSESFFE